MLVLRKITAAEDGLLEKLSTLIIDAVDGGASIGYLAPMSRASAQAFWNGVFAALGPSHALWVAELEGEVVGSVQLSLCQKENGRHRGEVQKLFVLQARRGLGIAAALMGALEQHARDQALRLLVLDTSVDSPAEQVYQRLGWTKAGEFPDYALNADGSRNGTALYFKQFS
jgi:GNAT superfamily N-acetyltransferase